MPELRFATSQDEVDTIISAHLVPEEDQPEVNTLVINFRWVLVEDEEVVLDRVWFSIQQRDLIGAFGLNMDNPRNFVHNIWTTYTPYMRIPPECMYLSDRRVYSIYRGPLYSRSSSTAPPPLFEEFGNEVLAYVNGHTNECAECGLISFTENDEHAHNVCRICEEVHPAARTVAVRTMINGSTRRTNGNVCNQCYDYAAVNSYPDQEPGEVPPDFGPVQCQVCLCIYTTGQEYDLPDRYRAVCPYCIRDFLTCPRCASVVRPGDATWHAESGECRVCYREQNPVGEIRSYSYKPRPMFFPSEPEDPRNPVYMGMELETSFQRGISPGSQAILDWLVSDNMGQLLYAKGDGSVSNGFEIVTHPMSPTWARQNFPFHKFQELIDVHKALPTHRSTGTHIHLNRDGFTKSQFWKFIQVHVKLPDFVGLVGGRGTDAGYGNLANGVREYGNRVTDLAKEKNRANSRFSRSNGINFNNTHTIELRYPRGGIAPSEIQKNIQWIQALYSYTNYINVGDVQDGALDNPGNLLWWIQQGDYPDLQEWINKQIPQIVPLKERV